MSSQIKEGNRLFDLSELLSYFNGDFDPSATLSKIEDSNIRVGRNINKSNNVDNQFCRLIFLLPYYPKAYLH